MRKQYEWFLKSGQVERAKEILKIPRYAHFAEPEVKEETKSKGKR